jgi:hypothetical protein
MLSDPSSGEGSQLLLKFIITVDQPKSIFHDFTPSIP